MKKQIKKNVLDKLGETINPFGKLISVGFSQGEGECWFDDGGVLCRYPTQFVQEELDKKIDKKLSKEYFNKF